ncbi:MAG: hypothetical protein DSY80_05210, partial [Desulfocapsa sp.]
MTLDIEQKNINIEDQAEHDDATEEAVAAELDLNRKIELAHASSVQTHRGKWENVSYTIAEFAKLLTSSAEGDKDGACFTQGAVNSGIRDHDHIVNSQIAVFDLSNGTTAEEIDEKLAKSGYAYVRHSTYRHLSDETLIHINKYTGFKKDSPITEDAARNYLRKKRGFSKALLAKASFELDRRPVIVKHEKIEKHHLILFLSEPFIFHGDGVNNQSAQKCWRELYKNLGKELELQIAHDCLDPGHAFYFPRHPEGGNPDALFKPGKVVSLPECGIANETDQNGSDSDNIRAELSRMNDKYSVVLLGGDSRIAMKNGDNTYDFLKKSAFFDL